MKKLLLLSVSLAFCCTLMQAKAPPKPADFSGQWLLDNSQTKNLPQGLESYSMVVNQDAKQLKVQTSLQGDLQPTLNPNGQYPGGSQGTGYPGGYPGGRMGRMGMGGPMGGMGMPGGPMGEGMPGVGMPGGSIGGIGRSGGGSRSHGATAAFMLYPRSAVYKLDGGESSAQLGGPERSDATLKADWTKNAKVLKLDLVGNPDSDPGGGQVEIKDQWKLSKDGQSLMVDRSVHSARSSKTVHLVFHKQAARSTG